MRIHKNYAIETFKMVAIVLKSAMFLLGIEMPDRM